jgi:hypothetical protein
LSERFARDVPLLVNRCVPLDKLEQRKRIKARCGYQYLARSLPTDRYRHWHGIALPITDDSQPPRWILGQHRKHPLAPAFRCWVWQAFGFRVRWVC